MRGTIRERGSLGDEGTLADIRASQLEQTFYQCASGLRVAAIASRSRQDDGCAGNSPIATEEVSRTRRAKYEANAPLERLSPNCVRVFLREAKNSEKDLNPNFALSTVYVPRAAIISSRPRLPRTLCDSTHKRCAL